jgi:hypothetical protein
LDPLSSEHAVLGSAGKASVFGTEASDVRRPCLYFHKKTYIDR